MTTSSTTSSRWRALTRHHLFWPVAVLVLLLLVNVPFTPDFFSIKMADGHLYGSLVSIVLFGSPLILVAVGMTLVIATGGIDLSVGAVVAITGALACSYISDQKDQGALSGVLLAMGLGLLAAVVCGLWNGFLVARMGIQPIIATLIIMVAGRGVAQLITDGQIITINSEPYKLIGGGYWLTLPFSIFVVAAVVAVTGALTRRTALGLLVEAVGGNAEASRLVGIRSRRIKILVYMFCALCAGIAGLMISSNTSAADGNNAGLWIELDAILAVVIGGTSLLGGRFSIGGTVVGALVIQTLTTTIYTIGVPTQTNLVFKAAVVIVVCLLQSPKFRDKVFGAKFAARFGAKSGAKPAATPADPAAATEAAPKMEVS
ncbi:MULTISPECIES: ABC transporter permease [unclassified Streptomyces]|uniref:ABC transporter permease n=1 Tax=unclassified Streptomyces TaxID=2593676 RepID=UPI00070B1F67|nr:MULTISPECIES: ABC transporter permease [unclassified Streptomyces]KRD00576.1 sugar ABC transporter permease [Streptomyces sp. Root264]MCX5263269.1 ABC transporter permease [Streptomyces sp. NBC_00199]